MRTSVSGNHVFGHLSAIHVRYLGPFTGLAILSHFNLRSKHYWVSSTARMPRLAFNILM